MTTKTESIPGETEALSVSLVRGDLFFRAERAVGSAPEIGPVADVQAIYEAVQKMRALPIGKSTLLAVLVPALIPVLIVISLQVPIGQLLLQILKALS